MGKLGVILPGFEKQWANDRLGQDDYLPFGMLIDNCSALSYVPVFDITDLELAEAWVDEIIKQCIRLPNNMDDLRSDLRDDRIGPFKLNLFFLENDKSRSAVRFALQND